MCGSNNYSLFVFLFVLLSVLYITSVPAESSTYPFTGAWGSEGMKSSDFNFPHGIAVDAAGNVYVADTENHRIQKFSSTGTFIASWGMQGSGNSQFNYPNGIAVDAAGNVYVADTENHRIQKFSSTGTFIASWGSQGSGNSQFNYPNSIAVDAAGNVYVADTENHRIQKFSSTGTFIASWGMQGSGNGEFSYPNGIAVDAAGNVYVADTENHRIQKFAAGGTWLALWGSFGSSTGQFRYPDYLAVNSSGVIFVTEWENSRVQVFDVQGVFLDSLGLQGSVNGEFNFPEGITLHPSGTIYIADSQNHRIQAFSFLSPSSISLLPGWNFISLPIRPQDTSITALLKDISQNVRIIWGYDNEAKQWLKHSFSASASTLTSLDAGKGYWIFMAEEGILAYAGQPASPKAIELNSGWNLIGYNGENGAEASIALQPLADKWSILWNWESGEWKIRKNGAANLPFPVLSNFYQKKAYWILIKPQAGQIEWLQQ